MNISLLLVSLILLISDVNSKEWEYKGSKGTTKWSELQPICGREAQSPINIKTAGVYPNPNLGLLHLNGYSQNLSGGNFINNGHTVQLNLPKDKAFKLSGNGINGNYTALQVHFHWVGSKNTKGGSEHTVNGNHYQAEMHIVHIKDPFTKLDDIKDMADGLAVIGVFLKANEDVDDNEPFQLLLDTISSCRYKGDTSKLTVGPSLLSLLPDSGSYFRYSGSLTTPPCYESVLWTVYKQPIVISKRQLAVFQNLTKAQRPSEAPENDVIPEVEGELSDNYRPVQSLNGRIVSAYYDIEIKKNSKTGSSEEWSYEGNEGPSHWYSSYPICKESRQSPVDLTKCDPTVSDQLEKLQFSSSYSKPSAGHVTNNGHTIQYSLQVEDDMEFWETEKKFKVLQVHFHWGKAIVQGKSVDHDGGSEHTVDSHHYPIEMHIVHKKSKEDNNTGDDLAVLGVFFQIAKSQQTVSNKTLKALEKITSLFERVTYNGEQADLEQGPALSDLLPTNKSYFRYMGSLTTPPCSETVMWTVLKNPLLITRDKFLVFQSLIKFERNDVIDLNSTKNSVATDLTDERSALVDLMLLDNYRPVQACNQRQVQIYIDEEPGSVAPAETDVMAIIVWSALGLVVFCAVLAMTVCCRKKETKEDKKTIYKPVPRRDEAV